MSFLMQELSGWASGLEFDDIPDRVVRWAKSQVLSQLAAIRAGRRHSIGAMLERAFGPPLQADPKRSACAMAAAGSWLHFDDTAYAGHLSNSTVAVPLAYARQLGLDGRALLTTIVAANECAARLTAAASLGTFQGQYATHTPLMGAVAARMRAEGAAAQRWTDAIGLAFGMPPHTLGPAFMGGDAKALNSLAPVRMGLDACDAAMAGLAGTADVIEHEDGFLSKFCIVPVPEALTLGLGERWHTETLSFKVHPSGPGGDAAVDCAIELSPLVSAEAIAEIVVHTSWYTVLVNRRAMVDVHGPGSPIAPLVLSIPYGVATALLTGTLTGEDFKAPAVDDARRWELAAKVRVEHDPDLTRACYQSTAPLGEALRQAGPAAQQWLRAYGRLGNDTDGAWFADLVGELGPQEKTFEAAAKATGARVEVRLADGGSVRRARDIPVGAVGPDTRARHPELVRRKFLTTGGAPEVADGFLALDQIDPDGVAELIHASLSLEGP